MKVGIVGLGLIGGSMAKALSHKHEVFAEDIQKDVLEKAIQTGAVVGELSQGVLQKIDVVLLALFPHQAIDYIQKHAKQFRKGSIVMDLCGVKRAIEKHAVPLAKENGFIYLGGHPMAGRARVGWEFANGELFRNASMIVVPNETSDEACLKVIDELSKDAGFACLTVSTADEHDAMIAYTSQLAHVLSSAYVKTPAALKHSGFSAGSFQDMTRVAWLNEEMWTELFLDNPDYLADEIDGLAERLTEYSKAIRNNSAQELKRLLREGRERKELLGNRE